MFLPRELILSTLFVAALVQGCGTTSLTRSGADYAPRPPDCDFHMYTSPPGARYVEVGTVDVSPGMGESNWTNDLGLFKIRIRPYVCEAGGDAAVAWANGKGYYVQATALKLANPPPPTPAAVAPAPRAPSIEPAPTAPATSAPYGCQYDTQCKGDRICVANQCTSP